MSKVEIIDADKDDSLDSPQAREPLRIEVTQEGREELALRALLRDAMFMLRRPDRYTEAERKQMVWKFAALINEADDQEGTYREEDEDGDEDDGDTDAGAEGEWP